MKGNIQEGTAASAGLTLLFPPAGYVLVTFKGIRWS